MNVLVVLLDRAGCAGFPAAAGSVQAACSGSSPVAILDCTARGHSLHGAAGGAAVAACGCLALLFSGQDRIIMALRSAAKTFHCLGCCENNVIEPINFKLKRQIQIAYGLLSHVHVLF